MPANQHKLRESGVRRCATPWLWAVGLVLLTASQAVAQAPPVFSYQRTLTNSLSCTHQVVRIDLAASNLANYVVEEVLSGALTASDVTEGGHWLPALRSVRWGPFTNEGARVLEYCLEGPPGNYVISGQASVDGAWLFGPAPTTVLVEDPVSGSSPQPTPRVAMPVILPPSGTPVPTNVTITCATSNAVIRYTLDGTLPDPGDPAYTGAFAVVTETVVRARGIRTDWDPSPAAVAYYPESFLQPEAAVSRMIVTSDPTAPEIAITFVPDSNLTCYAYVESLPAGVDAVGINQGGLYNSTRQEIKWGPFTNTAPRVFEYQFDGPSGSFTVRGRWSIDGRGYEEHPPAVVSIAPAGGGVVPPPPQQVATPVLDPASSGGLPVLVTISCDTPGALIYLTYDGTVPDSGDIPYNGPFSITSPATVRARAFKSGLTPSVAAHGTYEATSPDDLLVVRSISGSGSVAPQVHLGATVQGSVSCYTVTEYLSPGLTPVDVVPAAAWNPVDRTLKWGPYTDGASHAFDYRMVGRTGAYLIQGWASRDGVSARTQGEDMAVVDPHAVEKVAEPVLTPGPTGLFPVDVTLACTTVGAEIRYTVDGTTPHAGSLLYTGPVHLPTITLIKAQAFKPWAEASDLVEVLYGEEPFPGATLVRTVLRSGTDSPSVRIDAQPADAVACYSVSEEVPAGLQPLGIDHGGRYDYLRHTIKWGPFQDNQARALTYEVEGDEGIYILDGSGSFNGHPRATEGDQIVEVDNHLFALHQVSGNWTFRPSVDLLVEPFPGTSCYSVEEFLPAGIIPTNMSHGGEWNVGSLTIKWGPFLDGLMRTFHYEATGAHTNFETSCRLSVDGVGYMVWGDEPVVVGLPAPVDVAATAGDSAAYLGWSGSGHEAGFTVFYWLQSGGATQSVDAGSAEPGFLALTGLVNGTTYDLNVAAYDMNGAHSARSVTVSATPSSSAGVLGVVAFDQLQYTATGQAAMVTVIDPDLNTSPSSAEEVQVQVLSDTDTTGLWLTLGETGTNTGHFSSGAAGTNVVFVFSATDVTQKHLQVTEGDRVTALYQDASPAGIRTGQAQFMAWDGDGDGMPDWWERCYFGDYDTANAASDWDEDGSLDVEESIAGTHPMDPDSVFIVLRIFQIDGSVTVIQWPSVGGRLYGLEKSVSGSPETGYWPLVEDVPGTATTNEYYEAMDGFEGPVFYRLKVKQQ